MLVSLLILAAACGEAEPTSTTSQASGSLSSTTGITFGSTTTVSESSVPDAIIVAIVEDAALRFEIDPSAVEVISAESVTWNDASLGCPEEGVLYSQALIDGYRVVVAGAEQNLDYRVDSNGQFRVCDDPSENALIPEHLGEEDVQVVVLEARRVLAEMTGEEPDSLILVFAQFTSVPSSEPCRPASTDQRDPDSPLVPAIEVVLAVGDLQYRFVAAEGELLNCGTSPDFKFPGSTNQP